MKKAQIIYFILFIFLTGSLYSQNNAEQGLKVITPELLKKHIDYLASDSMKGRNTPSPELDLAANYIANEFELLGIHKINGSYFQNISLCSKNLDVDGCALKISLGETNKEFNLKTDYIPYKSISNSNASSSIVFAGYGITADEYNYDDYNEIDVKGKIVLIMKHEPGEKDPNSPFLGEKETIYSNLNSKLENAKNRGAIAVMVVTDPLNHLMLAPQGYPWASLSKFLPQDNLPIELCDDETSIPFIQVGSRIIKYLFESIDSLKNIQQRIDNNLIPQSFEFSNSNCQLTTKLRINNFSAKNVVGYIEGKNARLKDELLIIGGHYDHVGFKNSYEPEEDYIYNGADDNASGTAGILAIAKAFTSLNERPKRSILFILFAGEEKGLYGSKYYCENPLFPLEKTVAMINLDMISRNGNDSVEIEGGNQNTDLVSLMQSELGITGLKQVESDVAMYSRSDHYNFYKKNISSVSITSGLHKDYHKVSDDPDSIDPLKAALISQLCFRSALNISNSKKHFSIVKPKK